MHIVFTRDMNTTQTTSPVVTIDGTDYIFTGTVEGVGPEFRTATGAGFVGMRTYRTEGEFHMVPTARRGKIRGQFTWGA
jgi:hypothetical protein